MTLELEALSFTQQPLPASFGGSKLSETPESSSSVRNRLDLAAGLFSTCWQGATRNSFIFSWANLVGLSSFSYARFLRFEGFRNARSCQLHIGGSNDQIVHHATLFDDLAAHMKQSVNPNGEDSVAARDATSKGKVFPSRAHNLLATSNARRAHPFETRLGQVAWGF